jgi:alanyl-tRNA synthetase
MKMQTRLYYDQPYLREFNTEVLEILPVKNGVFRIQLRETAFYPTSGGQPNDKGWINSIDVFDVTEEEGTIYHYTKQAPTELKVHCEIDWPRRFDFMQQHAGQHILSEAFLLHCHAATIGFHLTDENLTIDLDITNLTNDQISQVEIIANQIVWRNLPINHHWVSPEEIKNLPLRKQPKVHENIRIIEVQDFDWSPCGGTHPSQTGEIGMIKIRRWERSKGVTRIEFFCGARALADYQWKNQMVLHLANQFSIKDQELDQVVLRQQSQIKELEKNLQEAESRLLEIEAEALRETAIVFQENSIIQSLQPETRTLNDLKKMVFALTRTPKTIVLLMNQASPAQFTFARTSDVQIPMNQLLKEIQKTLGGKGGGSEMLVQGSLTANCSPEDYSQSFLEMVMQYAKL